MALRTKIKSHSESVMLRAYGLPGQELLNLNSDDGTWKLTVPRRYFDFLEVGDGVVVVLGATTINIEEVPDIAPQQGLILPDRMQ